MATEGALVKNASEAAHLDRKATEARRMAASLLERIEAVEDALLGGVDEVPEQRPDDPRPAPVLHRAINDFQVMIDTLDACGFRVDRIHAALGRRDDPDEEIPF